MRRYAVMIVDDERPARELIKSFLAGKDDFEITGEADNGFQACLMINQEKPDLVFLDIQMPKLSGIELLDLLERPMPFIIFSTAYDDYAVQAFERNAVDYLLKPYNRERFDRALSKFISSAGNKEASNRENLMIDLQKARPAMNRLPVRSGSKIHILRLEEIRYIEAQDDYVKIHSTKGTFLKQQTMKSLEENLPRETFLRIHRSYILNINYLLQLDVYERNGYTAITTDQHKLPVSRQGARKLKNAIQLD